MDADKVRIFLWGVAVGLLIMGLLLLIPSKSKPVGGRREAVEVLVKPETVFVFEVPELTVPDIVGPIVEDIARDMKRNDPVISRMTQYESFSRKLIDQWVETHSKGLAEQEKKE